MDRWSNLEITIINCFYNKSFNSISKEHKMSLEEIRDIHDEYLEYLRLKDKNNYCRYCDEEIELYSIFCDEFCYKMERNENLNDR